MNKEQYWDEIADKVILPNGIISDNFDKRRKLLSFLTEYDFHNKRVLEIGCGLSIISMSLMMVNGGMKCSATDVSQKFVDWTNKVSYGKVKAVKAAADKLPFEDKSFDSIFMFDVLEHIHPDERQAAYSEISRVLKDDAMIFINNPLTQSFHDEAFDYGFFDNDLFDLINVIGGRVLRSNVFGLFERYFYQFWVLGRGAVIL